MNWTWIQSPRQLLIRSNLGHDWEFVEDTLSSRMQAITKWTDHQADNTVNRAFGITSETTDSMGELMAEIESHPLDSWQPDDMDDGQDIILKPSSTRQVLWYLQPTLLKLSSVQRRGCFQETKLKRKRCHHSLLSSLRK